MKRLPWLFTLLATAVPSLLAAPTAALAFSPDSEILAIGRHRYIELLSLTEARLPENISCELARISSVSFATNGLLAIAGGTPAESGAALVLSSKDRSVHRFTNFTDLATGVAFSRDASWLAVSSADGSAALYPLGAGRTISPISLRGHSGPVLDLTWSPENDLVVTASADRSLKVWARDGRLLRSFSHHTEPVNTVVFRPRFDADASPAQCASGSDDGTVRIWQPKIGRMVRIIRGHDGPVFALACTPDGKHLFSAGREGVIRRLDTESDQILGQWKKHDQPIYRLAISPNGKHLASGDWAGQVHLWKITDGELQPP